MINDKIVDHSPLLCQARDVLINARIVNDFLADLPAGCRYAIILLSESQPMQSLHIRL